MPFDLSIGPDDIDGILAALKTAFSVAVGFLIVAGVLVACAELDEWRKQRNSPVGKIERRKHFGGV